MSNTVTNKNNAEEAVKVKKQSQFREIMKRLYKNKTSVIGMYIFLALVLAALFAPFISPYRYDEINIANAYAAPSWQHICGTDNLGRDIFSRLLYGAKYSLGLGICAQIMGLTLGVALGCIAGYWGGKIDNLIMRFCDIWQAIPGMLFTIIIASALGTGWFNTVLAMGIGHIPSCCRMIRAQFLTVREKEFIEAEHAINCPTFLVIFKHMLPNALSPLIVSTTMSIGSTIRIAAGLSYLGMGVQPPTPEWGAMVTAGRDYIRYYPHMIIFPALAIAITILAINMFGDGLRDALDPKLKN